jgi:hypothetical protein
MSNIRLSHSSATKYQGCAKAWQLHYQKGLRSRYQSAALLFGSAIDKAAEEYVASRNLPKALKVFGEMWDEQEINGELTKLFDSPKIVYSNSDYDSELIAKSDYPILAEAAGTDNFFETIDQLYKRKEQVGFKYLKAEEKILLNKANWLCARQKGRLMVMEFAAIVEKNVEEVLGTQVKVELENDDGDTIIGYADFVFKWKGVDEPVIFDLKTSTKIYDDDAVKTSPQVSLYVFSLSHNYGNTRKAGFIVLNKQLRKNRKKVCKVCGHDGSGGTHKTCNNIIDEKRCGGEWEQSIHPTVNTQILIEDVSEILVERVIENFNEVNKGIKAEVFPRNFGECMKYKGLPCAYYDLCHSNKEDDLIVKK